MPRIYAEEKKVTSQYGAVKLMSTRTRTKLDACVSPCTKPNFSWTKDLNMKLETLKLLDKTICHYST